MKLIKDVRIIDYKKDTYGHVLISDGKIRKIFESLDNVELLDTEIIDGKGLCILPSFIDMHTHLRDPGFVYKEDLKTGQKAALKGGYTTLCTMANTKPVCDNEKTFKYILDKSKDLNLCDIIQISALTKGQSGKEIVNLESLLKFTNLFSDDGHTIYDEEIMKEALKLSKRHNFKVLTHCQPEYEIVDRDLKLLEKIGGNLHICHISLKKTIEKIKEYKDKGHKFTCEVTPHHIFKSNIDYKVNPSFRNKEDKKALIDGIKNDYIDVIATDHAPHSKEDKHKGSPGISLIEIAFSMALKIFKENNISLNKLSKLLSYNPAKILGLKSGLIKEGYTANLVLVDLDEEYKIDTSTFLSKGKNNPFNKEAVNGRVKMTIKEGEILYSH
ncbi:MAG: dihydroorotase [Firmicutes bacterium]|nr:dihydroorotase [Bacillota bacterium]